MAHTSLRNHNKLKDLAEFLDVTEAHAVGLLECLWWAVYDTRAIDQYGIMDGWADRHIARQAGWTGDVQLFIDALEGAGFIERTQGASFAIHDYADWAPEYLKKRWQRAGWDGEKPVLAPPEHICPDNGRQRQTTAASGRQRPRSAAYPTQPNVTERNVTERNQTEPKKDSCSSGDEPTATLKQQIEDIYEAYPHKVGPKAAKAEIGRVLKRGECDFETLLARVKAFVTLPDTQENIERKRRKEKHYLMAPERWFKKGRFDDDTLTEPADDKDGAFPDDWTPEQIAAYWKAYPPQETKSA